MVDLRFLESGLLVAVTLYRMKCNGFQLSGRTLLCGFDPAAVVVLPYSSHYQTMMRFQRYQYTSTLSYGGASMASAPANRSGDVFDVFISVSSVGRWLDIRMKFTAHHWPAFLYRGRGKVTKLLDLARGLGSPVPCRNDSLRSIDHAPYL